MYHPSILFIPKRSILDTVRVISAISHRNFAMDFEVDGNVDGEVLGISADMGSSRNDEDNDLAAVSSFEGSYQHDDDDEFNQGLSGRELALLDEQPKALNVSRPDDEPFLGQEFESETEAHSFYNAYATRIGFVTRVSKLSRSRRDGSAIGRALVCNKEGFRIPDKREKIVRQRAETRVGCLSMILVRKVSSGKWVVTKFVKEHTHPLTPGKGRRDLICDQYPNEHDKIRELSQQLAIEKKRSAAYKRHLEMLFEHIEEHNLSLSQRIDCIVDNVKEMESREEKRHRQS
ncbi:protein FAR1-RELATED SEQUENCE 5-like [Impatiens glandulifera]|uniref:protein FAR1-RELATED SEQUENCE 5-like n=1 Tax=Impatiens glandulifera TaxID=253017 RepID=UPI001FB1611B|nr:protein FAR1-RELATED SEQUENCE 5-like [Impatiens glandulifera]